MSNTELRLDLEQQKKRAKELRDAICDEDQDAIARVLRHHPNAAELDASAIAARFGRLSDAQLVLARELGLPSWPKLKAHIEDLQRARRAIASHAPPPDGDRATLHIRCGSDLRDPLVRAGFIGDFLEVSDPLCLGPLPRSAEDLVRVRARFLAEHFAADHSTIEHDYRRTVARLEQAHRFKRVVLWFEHDSYDQLILSWVLATLAAERRRTTVELICIDRFPAIARFIGLGQLPPEALRLLWESRAPVSRDQLRLAVAVWEALRAPSPSALFAIADGGTPELPLMARALTRHLQELPWTRDGLSFTQHLVLQALASGAQRACSLHRVLSAELEPLPFLGDSMLWAILRDMRLVSQPPFEIDDAPHWPDRTLSLNATGMRLLEGKLDWLTLHPPERWVGGVRINPGDHVWRWSGAKPVR